MALKAVLGAFPRPGRSQPPGRERPHIGCCMPLMGGKEKEPRRQAERGVLFSYDSIDITDYTDYTV